jgi:hypothetical protein
VAGAAAAGEEAEVAAEEAEVAAEEAETMAISRPPQSGHLRSSLASDLRRWSVSYLSFHLSHGHTMCHPLP